jgi:transcriptional regulator with XRE-family HTH domain
MNKIKYFRDKAGLTLAELSGRANVAVGYLSALERDADGVINPTKNTMEKIARALNKTVPKVFYPKE